MFLRPKKNNKPDDIQTINLYDTKLKDYGKIRLKFIEGKPDDEMLKNYLENFLIFYLKINNIHSIDITNDDIV